ncbi:MAG: CoB--CoM heterodisulfide reductase iron-sulfur subunit A family protein [Candidatus Korarchaeum sp.]
MPKVGVYVCHCGKNIAGKVDVQRVAAELKKHPAVAVSRHYHFMCSSSGQDLIKRDIRAGRIDRVVVAACSPKLHEPLFRGVLEEVGLNFGYFEQANIRELVSWSTEDPEEATKKALIYTWAAVEKVLEAEPVESSEFAVAREALVIGGGVAGIAAALDLAEKGIRVHLVERSPTIGGKMALLDRVFPTGDCSLCILTPMMAEAEHHGNVSIHTLCEVVGVSGSVGDFRVRVRRRARHVDEGRCVACGLCADSCPVEVENEWYMRLGKRKAVYIPFPQSVPRAYVVDEANCLFFRDGSCRRCEEVCPAKAIDLRGREEEFELKVGAIIVATGADEYDASNLRKYGYGKIADVITHLGFESLINVNGPTQGHLRRPSDGKVPESILFIQCAGSRDVNNNPYCSSVCCMMTLKHAEIVRMEYPGTKVYVTYVDMRTPKKGFEEMYRRVREEGVVFIRGKPSEVRREGDRLVVEVYDEILGERLRLDVDMVVLAAGLSPSEGTVSVSKLLNIPRDLYGFLQELHPKLKPVQTSRPGVFICGTAQGPKDIPDSVTQAKAAASEAARILMLGRITVTGEKARVNEELCTGCGACVEECPFSAISLENGRASVISLACAGCGTCQGACPTGAIERRLYGHGQILNQVDGMLEVVA